MISITCTHCRAHLTIDDAFAGGVCRCQYCGTIQTVPAKGKAQTPGAAAPSSAHAKSAAPATSKTLYKNTARTARGGSSGTGLDDLASAVASSGLSGSGLSSQRHTRKSPAAIDQTPAKRNLMPIVLVAAAVIVVLLGIVVFFLFRGRGASPVSSNVDGGDNSTAVAGSADFCGIPLHARSTIFLLDRGNSISEQFDMAKAVCFKAVSALGPSRQFQVILWDNDSSGQAEFPVGQMADATAGRIDEMRHEFQDSIASGRSHLSSALVEATSRHPQEIVIVTGKGADDLDDDDSAALQSMIGKNIRIDAVQVYPVSPSPNKTLQEVSRATGGQYRDVSAPELREMAH